MLSKHHKTHKHHNNNINPEEMDHFGGALHNKNKAIPPNTFTSEEVTEFSYSSETLPNGKKVTKKYYGEMHKAGKHGLQVEEMREVYGDSETGLKKEAKEKMIGDVGKRVVRCRREGEEGDELRVYYKGDGAEDEDFEEKWGEAAEELGMGEEEEGIGRIQE